MKLKITLSQKPSVLSVISGAVTIPQLTEQNYIVTYNMTKGCSTTDKFINLYKENIGEKSIVNFNIYKQSTLDKFIKLKVEMNSIIQKINTEKDDISDVDESLMLDTTSLDIETPKLNALHLYFEDESNKIIVSGQLDSAIESGSYLLLEDINQLVHSIERGYQDYTDFSCFIRQSPLKLPTPTLPCTDEDYENFHKNPKWGDLALNFFRVGKDLNHCYMTDDLKLIKTKGLAQQNTVHTCYDLIFDNWRDDEELDNYEKAFRWWIDKNNLKKYYNTDLPMFNLGRCILGKIDMTDTSEEEVQYELDKCTAITNVELIDE